MADVLTADTEMVPIDDLVPHPANYNLGDVDSVREGIRTNGFYGDIIRQQSTGYIIAGHTRVAAAREEGLTHLPTKTYDVDDATARRILAHDNRSREKASRDTDKLVSLLSMVKADAGDLVGTGYSASDLNALEARQLREAPQVGDASTSRSLYAYGVVITCADEAEQVTLLDRFLEEGLDVRALT